MTTGNSPAVFLSYASQDAEAARRICEALRAAGVEVWFDQSELRGGDAWDAKIRKQIKECALFVPIISANTQARTEGYFRLEWRLADQRTHLMAKGRPFLLPIVIDDTRDSEAQVPDSFCEVQWTRLRQGFHLRQAYGGQDGGQARDDARAADFATRVRTLLDGQSVTAASRRAGAWGGRQDSAETRTRSEAGFPRHSRRLLLWGAIAGVGLVLSAGVWWQRSKRVDSPASPRVETSRPEIDKLITKIRAVVALDADATRDDWLLAEKLGAQAVELEPSDGRAWTAYADATLGLWLFYFDRTRDARADALRRAGQAVNLAPHSNEAKLVLALCYVQRSETIGEAELMLRNLIQEGPRDARRLRGLAAALRARAARDRIDLTADKVIVEDALALYDRAAALPDASAALREKAALLAIVGRAVEAEQTLERSLALKASPAGTALKIQMLLRFGRLAEACAVVEKLPGSYLLREDICSLAATTWLWKREPERCLRVLNAWPEEFLGFSPKNLLAGQAHQMARRPEAARLAWQAALAKVDQQMAEAAGTPQVAPYLQWRVLLLAALGERERAEEALQTFLQAGRSGAMARARVYAAMNKASEAMEALQQVLPAARVLLGADVNMSRLSTGRASLEFDPEWDGLRSDPRFQALIDDWRRQVANKSRQETAAPVAPAADAKSVAVLAFENRSSEKDSGYFSDGVSDELINVLGRVGGLKVIARTSSFAFKGNRNASAQEIARALGVAHLVEGSVQQTGGRARVIARLIRADSGEQVWGDSFDAEVKDILTAQVTTARAIAEAMTLRLNAGARMASLNPEAVKLYLQGRQEWGLRTIESMRRAEDLFTRSIAREPKFARAHSGLVDAWVTLGQHNDSLGLFVERDSVEMRRVIERARLAVALDPDSAEAQASLGGALVEAWRPEEARRALERALELNPSYATAHQWLGRALLKEGRAAEAIASLRRACELDPLSSRMADNLGISLWFVGRGQEGLIEIDRALQLKPDSEQAEAQRAMVLAGLGRHEEAMAQARAVLKGGGFRVMHAVCALAVAGRQEEAARAFDSQPKARALSRRAHALAALGRWDECLAASHPDTMVPATAEQMLFHVVFDPVRSDPRFVAILETLGLTEAHARAQAWRAANPPQKAPVNK